MAHGLCWLLLSTPCVLPLPQLNKVHVYRLITKKTYESEMFRRASRKLGLSQAVFETGGIQRSFSGAEEPQAGGLVNLMKMDKNKVEMLLRFGAYAIMDDDNSAADQFMGADIDKILGQAETVKYDEVRDADEVLCVRWERVARWCARCEGCGCC